ncbi:MAG: hypothetical protein VCC99_17120 [Alphaproteobacteria bacterium]
MYYDFSVDDPAPRIWGDALVERIEDERREIFPAAALAARAAWRDRRLADLVAGKMRAAKTIGD